MIYGCPQTVRRTANNCQRWQTAYAQLRSSTATIGPARQTSILSHNRYFACDPIRYQEVTRTPLDVGALNSNERSSALYFDLARALVQDGARHDAEAIRHLDTADRLAPTRIRNDPIARDLVRILNRRARRQVWELDSLRNRFGMASARP